MENVYLTMSAYLITVDDLQEGLKYHVCATETAAHNLFKKIVMEHYFDPEEDEAEDLGDAYSVGCGFWESKNGDVVKCVKCRATVKGGNLVVTKD